MDFAFTFARCEQDLNVNEEVRAHRARPAMPYTHLYSVHPYWWKRQVSHQLWPSGSQHASKKECRRDIHSGFETHEEGHAKSKTGAISGSTKWTLVQRKYLKKKKSERTILSVSFWHLPSLWINIKSSVTLKHFCVVLDFEPFFNWLIYFLFQCILRIVPDQLSELRIQSKEYFIL